MESALATNSVRLSPACGEGWGDGELTRSSHATKMSPATTLNAFMLGLCRSDGGWTGTKLDRSGRLELLAVEVERHDLFLDHALDQKGSVVLAPGETLTPMAGLGLGQRNQFLTFDAQHLHQSVIGEERTILRLVGSVTDVHGGKGAVGRERDPFRRLTNRDGLNDARRFCLGINQAYRIRIAAADSDIGHHRELAVRCNGDMAWARFLIPQIDLSDRRERRASNGKHGHRSFRAVRDQRQCPGAIDRYARGAFARLQLRRDFGRRGFEIDDRQLVVGHRFLRIARIDLGCAGHQREALIARDRYTQGRPDDARRSLELSEHLRWDGTEIDDGHCIRRRVGRYRIYAVDKDGLAVVGGNGKLPAGAGGYRDQRGERKRAESSHMAIHENLPLRIVMKLRTRRARARTPS